LPGIYKGCAGAKERTLSPDITGSIKDGVFYVLDFHAEKPDLSQRQARKTQVNNASSLILLFLNRQTFYLNRPLLPQNPFRSLIPINFSPLVRTKHLQNRFPATTIPAV